MLKSGFRGERKRILTPSLSQGEGVCSDGEAKETSPFTHTQLSLPTFKRGISDRKDKGEVMERCFLLEFYKKVVQVIGFGKVEFFADTVTGGFNPTNGHTLHSGNFFGCVIKPYQYANTQIGGGE